MKRTADEGNYRMHEMREKQSGCEKGMVPELGPFRLPCISFISWFFPEVLA